MGAMIAPLLALAKTLAGQWFGDYLAKKQNAREIAKAVAENKIRLAQSAASHNQQWEMAALENADKWLRRASFFLLTFPLVWAGIDPAGAKLYFSDALAAVPDWYVGAYVGMIGAIWGLAELKQWRRVPVPVVEHSTQANEP